MPRQKNCNSKVHPISCDCTVAVALFLPWGGKQERGAHVRPCPCLGALGATFWGSFSLCWGHFRGYLVRKLAIAQVAEAAMLMRASQQRLASDDGTAPAQARSLAPPQSLAPPRGCSDTQSLQALPAAAAGKARVFLFPHLLLVSSTMDGSRQITHSSAAHDLTTFRQGGH